MVWHNGYGVAMSKARASHKKVTSFTSMMHWWQNRRVRFHILELWLLNSLVAMFFNALSYLSSCTFSYL